MKRKTIHINVIRQAIADYINTPIIRQAYGKYTSNYNDILDMSSMEKVLAELLDIPLKLDGSGYDFGQFRTVKLNEGEGE